MAAHSQGSIDSIESVSRRPLDWPEHPEEQEAASFAVAKTATTKPAVDVIESIAPDPETKVETKRKKLETSPGFFATLWHGFWNLFGGSTSVSQTTSGGGSKTGSTPVQGIGGAPTLESPVQMEMKQLLSYLKEAQEALQRVQATQAEAEGTEADARHLEEKWLRRFSVHLQMQRQLCEEAAQIGKTKFVFDQNRYKALRKDLFDYKKHVLDSAAEDRFWGRMRLAATVVTVAITVSIIAINVIPTAGFSLAALPAALPTALKLLQPVAAGAQGVTNLMKGMSSKQLGEKSAELTRKAYAEKKLRLFGLDSGMKQFNGAVDQSLKIVTDYLNRIQRKRHDTMMRIIRRD